MSCDERYVDRKSCEKQGFVELNGRIYKLTVLEKYWKKGWLRLGCEKYSDEDRYRVGVKFYSDYQRGHVAGMVASGWRTERVDCGQARGSDDVSYIRARYWAAIKVLPREFWEVVRRVCIEDKELDNASDQSERRRLEMSFALKRDLCRGLDRLIEFYNPKI